jgi:hypothetical protein
MDKEAVDYFQQHFFCYQMLNIWVTLLCTALYRRSKLCVAIMITVVATMATLGVTFGLRLSWNCSETRNSTATDG